MIHKLQVLVLILLVPFLGFYLFAKSEGISMREIFSPGTSIAHVGEIPISVEIVDSAEERRQGLSGRKEMQTSGMLFVFDEPGYHQIWMKDMHFPIDIIWISEELVVVGIDRGVRPDSYPKTFIPPSPARYAIETEERYTDTFGIGVGDTVRLPLRLEE